MDFRQIEAAAEVVLGTAAQDPAVRHQAQAQLIALSESLASIPLLQSVLDNSVNSFAVMAAAQALQKIVSDHWNSFSETQRVDIRASRVRWGASPAPLALNCPAPVPSSPQATIY